MYLFPIFQVSSVIAPVVLFKNYPTHLGADKDRKMLYTFLALPLI